MRNRPGKTELFKGRHFEQEIIILCVCWYLRYKLSYRDLAEMMAERGCQSLTQRFCAGCSVTHRSSTSAGVAFQCRQVRLGEWMRPMPRFATGGLISTGLSMRRARPSPSGSAHGATSPRPRHSSARPYVPRVARPRRLRWTDTQPLTGQFESFSSKGGLPR